MVTPFDQACLHVSTANKKTDEFFLVDDLKGDLKLQPMHLCMTVAANAAIPVYT